MRFPQTTMKFRSAAILLACSVLILISSNSIRAQQIEKTTPLHEFFQKNFDSTVIYHSWSSWYSAPNYLILAKQKNQLYYFTYTSPYKKILGRSVPGNLSQKFKQEEREFKATAPDTNRYLLLVGVLQDVLNKSWEVLQATNLWELKDDRYSLQSIGNCMIDDGTTNTFYLITKAGIKIQNFYEPDFWEECLGKDLSRQKAISARTIFERLAKEN